ncbi:importin subunit alpha-4 [Anaeramoeba ignava]|uniref:Importin subunit alpha n=1 Tax=Anaeramoeba ignava TaxID=1746090 RepID=A0A9Q0LWZ2_ANAIG|nr:importin subunit alpha-4 [Anaeramoeba ignava]
MSYQKRIKERVRNNKKRIDLKEAKNKRHEITIKISKNKKEYLIMNKRSLIQEDEKTKIPETLIQMIQNFDKINQFDDQNLLQFLKELKNDLDSRKSVEFLFESGKVPLLVHLLNNSNLDIRFEILSILTKITNYSDKSIHSVVENDGIKTLIELFNSLDFNNSKIQEQIILLLNNISFENIEYRDFILSFDIINKIINFLNQVNDFKMINCVTLFILNLTTRKPSPDFEYFLPFFQIVENLLSFDDLEIIANTCWIISNLSEDSIDNLQEIIDLNICPKIINFLDHPNSRISTPALKIIGNIITGYEEQTQYLLDLGILNQLKSLLFSSREMIRKEACWIISNITGGSFHQMREVVNYGMVPILIKILKQDEYSVRIDASWCLANIAFQGENEDIFLLIYEGYIEPLCEMLDLDDISTIILSLDSISKILFIGNQVFIEKDLDQNPYLIPIEEFGGFNKIQFLQNHKNKTISQKSAHILKQYFVFDENENENENENKDKK